MNISPTYQPTTRSQLRLFEQPLGNHGHRRTVIGKYYEMLTASFLRGHRHKTNSQADYCPDISLRWPFGGPLYLECKAVGRSRTAFVYKGRLERDYEFAQSHALGYVIWHHFVKTNDIETVEALHRELGANTLRFYIVPFHVVWELVADRQPEKLNSKYGRSHEYPGNYGMGYKLPLRWLDAADIEPFEWRPEYAAASILQEEIDRPGHLTALLNGCLLGEPPRGHGLEP